MHPRNTLWMSSDTQLHSHKSRSNILRSVRMVPLSLTDLIALRTRFNVHSQCSSSITTASFHSPTSIASIVRRGTKSVLSEYNHEIGVLAYDIVATYAAQQ